MQNQYPLFTGTQSSVVDSRHRNAWKIATLILAGVFVLGVIFYGAFSPFLTLWNMRNAALAKDGKTFASYIDFPVFKENLKAELNALMLEKVATDKELKNNPFSGLGLLLAPTIINNLVDSLVTPAGVERLMSGQFLPPDSNMKSAPAENPFTSENVNFSYVSLNEFRMNVLAKDGKVTSLVFERHWLGDWKLANIKLPR